MEYHYLNPYYVQDEYYKLVKPKKKYKQYTVYRFKGNFKHMSRITGINALFLILFHLLYLIP